MNYILFMRLFWCHLSCSMLHFFFFFKQKTAYEMRISDWSSDVCSSDLLDSARALLPQASYVYVADSAGFPYGTKSEREIEARVPALLGRLAERYRPRLIVIACNTASTIALASVHAALDLAVVGTVDRKSTRLNSSH